VSTKGAPRDILFEAAVSSRTVVTFVTWLISRTEFSSSELVLYIHFLMRPQSQIGHFASSNNLLSPGSSCNRMQTRIADPHQFYTAPTFKPFHCNILMKWQHRGLPTPSILVALARASVNVCVCVCVCVRVLFVCVRGNFRSTHSEPPRPLSTHD